MHLTFHAREVLELREQVGSGTREHLASYANSTGGSTAQDAGIRGSEDFFFLFKIEQEKELWAQRRKYKFASPLSDFVTLMLSSVYMLSKWRFMRRTFELFQRTGFNWLIYILFISESLASPAKFMANLQKV